MHVTFFMSPSEEPDGTELVVNQHISANPENGFATVDLVDGDSRIAIHFDNIRDVRRFGETLLWLADHPKVYDDDAKVFVDATA